MMVLPLITLLLLVANISPLEAFGPSPIKFYKQRNVACRSSVDENQEESTLDVIQKSMGGVSSVSPINDLIIRPTRRGLSGFSTDVELGFVAVLTSGDKKSTHVVVSPVDKTEVRSPEALCMVQLAGGMDLGTGVLPPDLLAQLVADDLELECDEIRLQLRLLQVHAVPNDQTQRVVQAVTTQPVVASSPERDAKLAEDVVKFLSSVKNLPGLSGCTQDQVLEALKLHASKDGSIDRQGFTAVLDTLRRGLTTILNSNVTFELVVSVDDTEHRIVVPTAVHALGLAMRYDKEVRVSADIQFEMTALEVLSRFPKFRPIEDLQEDARLADGLIPNMSARRRAPKADDRQL